MPWTGVRSFVKELLLPGVVFFLTAVLVTNQAGLADSLLGVLGVMLASGLGMLACMTASRPAHAIRVYRRRGSLGERSVKSCQWSVDLCGTQLLWRGTRDP